MNTILCLDDDIWSSDCRFPNKKKNLRVDIGLLTFCQAIISSIAVQSQSIVVRQQSMWMMNDVQ